MTTVANRMTLAGLAGISVFVSTALSATAEDATVPAIGEVAERFGFVDIRYVSTSLDDFGETPAFVLLFLSRRCPVANRYAPRMRELEAAYRERGVRFVAVFSRADGSIVEMAAWAVDHEIPFPVVEDRDGQAARAVGATRTPQAIVLGGDRKIRYRGRIDARYLAAGSSPEPGREDLREALEEVLALREVAVPETEVDGCLLAPAETPRVVDPVPTFASDVAPILASNCQGCHRPGGEAPFALVSYEDARAMAAMIREVVETRRMPPWHADPRHGDFANARRLADREREVLLAWARGGTPLGDPARLPAPIEWPAAEWKISEPDIVLEVPYEVQIPAQGYVPYKYAALHPKGSPIPLVFTEDTWVQEIQILSRNPKVLHHANLIAVDPMTREERGFLTGQVPGGSPMRIEPGTSLKIEKGIVLALQMHYVTTGVEESDRIRVGFVFPRERIRKALRHLVVADRSFAIPPGDPFHEVKATKSLEADSIGLGMFVHMHVRGKDMRFVAQALDGTREDLLLVPNYSFDWQQSYLWETGAKRFPAGTRIECTAHFDNSTFNPFNPDPMATVRFGQQTYEEMMYGFFFYILEGEDLGLEVDPRTGRAPKAK